MGICRERKRVRLEEKYFESVRNEEVLTPLLIPFPKMIVEWSFLNAKGMELLTFKSP